MPIASPSRTRARHHRARNKPWEADHYSKFDTRLGEETDVPVNIVPNALEAVVLGAGRHRII